MKKILVNGEKIEVAKKRNIGLDGLRIISMIMIVFLHYLGKGGLLDIENTSNLYHIIYYFIEALSIIAVNCYVLISGYFLIKSKFKWKKVLQLWLETLFYSIFVYVIIVVLGLKEIDIKGIIKSLFPIITKEYWFINIYLVMYILSPFLNKLVNSMSKKEYQKLLIILIICFCIISILPDAYTDITDLLMLKRYLLGMISFDEYSEKAIDLNADEVVDITDLLFMRRLLLE